MPSPVMQKVAVFPDSTRDDLRISIFREIARFVIKPSARETWTKLSKIRDEQAYVQVSPNAGKRHSSFPAITFVLSQPEIK